MQVSQELNHQGNDKVARYNWRISDERGKYMDIQKDILLINHDDYQREASGHKVLEIARDWSWVACNTILVARRDGRYYVIDGQYRTLAARRRSDIKTLPCIVFDVFDVKQEADGFLKANTNRKPISSRDRFRALVTTENENAVFIEDLLQSSGRKADSGPNSARCLTALLAAAENNRDALMRVWPIVDKICDGRSVHTHILKSLIWIEGRMADGMSLADRKWKERLLSAGYDDLIDATRKAEGFVGNGGERVWGEGILQRLNKGLQKKLKVRTKGKISLEADE